MVMRFPLLWVWLLCVWLIGRNAGEISYAVQLA
ncbi:hypothetical protein N802_05310 [Knoellia sinensis KCTC 19936]|uniref:Uncharacterized protein n=1 Tax=Knoellia sinensis KCTC 19936 TaxID=1385520 RepID=A0A0A0J2Y0_9MICO|nr:hypothetical protein N802_05310 [Knoellia sinensis KCTC 19936]